MIGAKMIYPAKLKPALKDNIWGGKRLVDEYGKQTNLSRVAESWELSCHKDGLSVIAEGPSAGMTLAAYIAQEGRVVLGTKYEAGEGFPLLVKLIDAREDLSVQVHPGDEYALRVEGENGKTEMWYIIDAEPGAELIYGFKQEISEAELESRIAAGTLLDVVNRVPVKRGDVFLIKAGTLHSIGAGILLCEIQQSSNTTYRVYDYGRVGADGKPRELHVKKALDVVERKRPMRGTEPQAILHGLLHDADAELLLSSDVFTAYHVSLHGILEMAEPLESFESITVTDGSLIIDAHDSDYQELVRLTKGESVFLPAGMGAYALSGSSEFVLSMG